MTLYYAKKNILTHESNYLILLQSRSDTYLIKTPTTLTPKQVDEIKALSARCSARSTRIKSTSSTTKPNDPQSANLSVLASIPVDQTIKGGLLKPRARIHRLLSIRPHLPKLPKYRPKVSLKNQVKDLSSKFSKMASSHSCNLSGAWASNEKTT